MTELHIKGYLCNDDYYNIAVSDDIDYSRYASSIVTLIEGLAREHGMYGEHRKGLGGRVAYIDDCNIRIYYTESECELEDAMEAMDAVMYGGDIKTKTNWCGYSEYTITGLDLEEFSIGGHDLDSELRCHMGEYMHMIIEC